MIEDWQAVIARVRAALMRRGRTGPDADDLVQEAWIRLACYERDQDVQQPEAFLMRTALNLSIDAHRTRASRGEDVCLEQVVLIDAQPSAEATLLAKERMARLTACIGRLSDKRREVFLAQRVEGLSYQEIAARHRISVSAVEKHVAKAMLQLTCWMEGWWP